MHDSFLLNRTDLYQHSLTFAYQNTSLRTSLLLCHLLGKDYRTSTRLQPTNGSADSNATDNSNEIFLESSRSSATRTYEVDEYLCKRKRQRQSKPPYDALFLFDTGSCRGQSGQ
jgi:hypothetical protein